MRILTEALTFDDVSLVPAYSNVLPRDVDLSTRLTRDIRLNIPILSAAMDTVTEARLAITLAQTGGIGIIHKNMPPSRQAREVERVKRAESGMIASPITVRPDQSLREALGVMNEHDISGVPVVEGEHPSNFRGRTWTILAGACGYSRWASRVSHGGVMSMACAPDD